jgi:hypothetical protein
LFLTFCPIILLASCDHDSKLGAKWVSDNIKTKSMRHPTALLNLIIVFQFRVGPAKPTVHSVRTCPALKLTVTQTAAAEPEVGGVPATRAERR